MAGGLVDRILSWSDANLATLGHWFMREWSKVERSYRRPFSRIVFRLKFAFYPLLAVGAIAWLAWDWSHARSLAAAENAIFDYVVQWRPFEPKPSGQVVVVEIDECSIEHFRARGEGGWPWSRQRHADLLDQLDRAGVAAVGYDVLFTDPSQDDPLGDQTLEAMAEGGAGRFIFGSTRLHPDYDERSPLPASQAPSAFSLVPDPRNDPKVALLLPFGEAMARNSAILNVTRNEDGVLRDIPLREAAGDWALPSLSLRLAMTATPPSAHPPAATVRPNWREETRLPHVSAADLLVGEAVCRDATAPLPPLDGRVVLVGYTASGLNDAKPTPVDPVMPGVEVLAEATEALLAGSAIRMPPGWLKYFIATLMTLFTAFAFYRGEPAPDIDSVFVAANVALLSSSFIGLTFFGFFFDIFASVGFGSLIFGSAAPTRDPGGRAVGNERPAGVRPRRGPLAGLCGALRADVQLDETSGGSAAGNTGRLHFLYAGSNAVMLEGVVERKTWLHDALSDIMIMVWHGGSAAAARAAALDDLARLERELAEYDERLPDDGTVLLAFGCAQIDDGARPFDDAERLRLRDLMGRTLASSTEWPLTQRGMISAGTASASGGG
jgi:CHASE2 domain-containing sensor protein